MYLLIRLFQIDILSNDILVRPRRHVHALHVTLENCLKSLATPLLIFTNSCHISMVKEIALYKLFVNEMADTKLYVLIVHFFYFCRE